jgi:hypothetical protein
MAARMSFSTSNLALVQCNFNCCVAIFAGDPTNSFSVLKMLAPTNTPLGLALSWQSVAGKSYDLHGAIP